MITADDINAITYKQRDYLTVAYEAFLVGCIITFIGIVVSVAMGAHIDLNQGYFWGMVSALFLTGFVAHGVLEYTKVNYMYSQRYLKQLLAMPTKTE